MLRVDDVVLARPGFRFEAGFGIAAGTRAAVIGPSGGGKSTLLSLITGFDTPDEGRIWWGERDVTDDPPNARPVAMLFQDNNLFPHLDIETNVALGADPVARPSEAARSRAREALERVGLADQARKKPGALSGGQQSRAALARLLLTARPLVLLDEPFAALGPALRRDMWALLVELLPEATILMVTHDPEEAERSAGVILFVEEGRVQKPIETADFFANPSEAVARYLR